MAKDENRKYTRQTVGPYYDPELKMNGVQVTAWTEDAWNRAQEAKRRYQADQEWQRAHPFLAGVRNFGRNVLSGVGNFVNDEILLNKNNIRVKNARKHPKAMDAIQEGGNIAGAIVAAPFAAYAAAETAPIWMPALKTAGQAMTPSTWVGGFFDAFGTQAPAWLLNGSDLAASAYFAGQAGREIDKNGLNWKTGTNALLSLAPFTREESAIRAVGSTLRNPVSSFSSVIDDFRAARNAMSSPEANIAREFNRSVKNTRFVNVPIEHVSNRGMTEGAGLNSYSTSDVGFHFSPAGSPTTYNIQQATNAPFVRTGTWTYTNNTKPVFVIDKGNWRYSFNPEIYQGVNPGKTVAENAMALNQKGPNFMYVNNNYEGRGARSFMTTQPSSVQLSKNKIVQDDRFLSEPSQIVPEGLKLPDGTYTPAIEDPTKLFADLEEYFQEHKVFPPRQGFSGIDLNQNGTTITIGRYYRDDPNTWYVSHPNSDEWKTFDTASYSDPLQEAKKYALSLRGKLLSDLDDSARLIVKRSKIVPEMQKVYDENISVEGTEVGDKMMNSIQEGIDNFYLSPEYIDRFVRASGADRSRVIETIRRDLQSVKSRTKPVLYKSSPNNRGTSWTSYDESDQTNFAGLNAYQPLNQLKWWDSTLFHEFGHNIYRSDNATSRFIRGTNHDLTLDMKDHIIFVPKNEGDREILKYISNPNEFRQRIMEGVRYGVNESLTPEEIYDSPIMTKIGLAEYFDKEYLIKMLGLMLGSTPVIVNKNKNDKNS